MEYNSLGGISKRKTAPSPVPEIEIAAAIGER